jgi:hypothetical protein
MAYFMALSWNLPVATAKIVKILSQDSRQLGCDSNRVSPCINSRNIITTISCSIVRIWKEAILTYASSGTKIHVRKSQLSSPRPRPPHHSSSSSNNNNKNKKQQQQVLLNCFTSGCKQIQF